MLPATEKFSPAIAPHHSTQLVPVCCPMRPSASMTCNCRCSRPSSGAVSCLTTSGAGTPRQEVEPMRAGTADQRRGSAPTPLSARANADGEEARRDRDTERAAFVARDDRPGHGAR
jgi:hypothetical protein